MDKRKVTVGGILKLINDAGEIFLPLTREGTYRQMYSPRILNLEDYFPSEIKRVANRLIRKGHVQKEETSDGWIIKITNKGKNEILKFKLEEFKPKKDKWDGLWRLVFFDIEEVNRKKRDMLRKYLKKLGLKQMQESVWVGPFNVSSEVKYLREVLDVPHGVKMGVMKELENDEDLKEWFEL